MDDNADAKRILLAYAPADWRRQLGHQQIWLRTALCGGWCRRMALRNRELHARNDDDDAIIIALTLSYTPGHLLYKNAANLLSLPDL